MIREILPDKEYRQTLRNLQGKQIAYTHSAYSENSASVAKWGIKFVNASCCLDFEGERLLPGEVAKKVLKDWTEKANVKPQTPPIPAPHFYLGGKYEGENTTYIDIKAAYATIYKTLYLESVFTGKHLFSGWTDLNPIEARLHNCKPARNAIPGILSANKFTVTIGEKNITVNKPTDYYNPNIRNYCNFICHIVARHAADKAGLIYWNTDGGFCLYPEPIIEICNHYGLRVETDTGKLTVNAFNNYSFSGTLKYRQSQPAKLAYRISAIDNIAIFKRGK
jgi:hypothetical protein